MADETVRKDGCIPVSGPLGNLAKKLGGELVRNKDGMFVLQGVGADEAVFKDAASAHDFMTRSVRAAALNTETHEKINDLINNGQAIPISNFEEMVKFHDDLSRAASVLHGGEQPGRVGLLSHKLGLFITRQQGWLMRQGEGGRYLANGFHRFNVSREHFEINGEAAIRPAARLLKTITTPAELKNGTAPRAAQELYNKVIKPYIDSVHDMADFLGIGEDLAPRDGSLPTWFGIDARHLDYDTVQTARQMRILGDTEGAAELANRFNLPDFGPQPRGMSVRDWNAAKRWLKKKGTAFAGEANHMRTGAGFLNDIEATLVGWNRAVSRRLAEAAVFGPNLERIHQAMEIMGNGPFKHNRELAEAVIRDMRGKVYLPRTEVEKVATNVARFSLTSSASRHISQNKITIMQHGFVDTKGDGLVRALGKELFNPGDWKGDVNELRQLGVFMKQAVYEVGEHPGDLFMDVPEKDSQSVLGWLYSNGIEPAIGMTAKASTLGIHIMVNTDRLIAGVAARNLFDSYFERAINGDRNKLALFADMLGTGDPTTEVGRREMGEMLKGLDRQQAKNYFVKRMADTAGTTYHPGDLPGLARVRLHDFDLGRWLTMFRGFRWNVAHNIWNQMFSPNYSLPYRLRVFGRFMAATSFLSPLDVVMRHAKVVGALGVAGAAFGVGISNIDSETTYKAVHKALKDPSTSRAIYAMTMLMVNDGTLGIAADMVQGFNLNNPYIFDRAIVSGNIPIMDKVGNIAIGASSAINGSLSDDEADKKRALNEFLQLLPLGDALSRAAGTRKPPKVPKHQVIRSMLHKGAREVGLH